MTETEGRNDKTGIQVLARAAEILRTLREAKTGLSLGQIALQTNLPRSTVQRITGALADEKFVMSDPHGKGLIIGPELRAFAGSAQDNVVEQCRLFLIKLSQKTGETADLSIMRGVGMTFLDQVPGTHRLTTLSKVGEDFPLTTTANGRACLAQLPTDDAVKLIQSEWVRADSQGELDALLKDLDKICKTGLAYDLDNHSSGISAIGFAFRDWGGSLHAISVPMPSIRYSDKKRAVESALRTTKHDIETLFQL